MPDGDGWLFEPKWDGFRCIVFRDGDEVELGSRNERPLTRYFPELLEPLRQQLPDAVRRRRRDRRRHRRRRARLRRAAAAHPPGRVARCDAGGRDAGVVRRLRPAGARRRRRCSSGRSASVARAARAVLRRRRRPIHLTPGRPRPSEAPRLVRAVRGRRARRRRRQAGSTSPTSPTSARCSRSSTSAPPTAWSPATASTRTARASARCCSGCTTTTASCTTSASPRRSRPPAARSCSPSWSRCARTRSRTTRGGTGPEMPAHADGPGACPARVSRWNAGKDLSWVPLRIERVAEVDVRAACSQRPVPPRRVASSAGVPTAPPRAARYDQLDVAVPRELAEVFEEGR